MKNKEPDTGWTADRTPRLYVTGGLGDTIAVELTAPHSHYLKNVMRAKPGATVRLFNGRDGEWRAEVEELARKAGRVVCREQTREQIAAPDLHYLFAPLKQARLDYMIQKATEMGAGVLQPVRTAYTNVARIKLERCAANAVEAAEQCNLLSVPEVRDMAALGTLLAEWDADRRLIYCDEAAPLRNPAEALDGVGQGPLGVLIGPEGGFSPDERKALRDHPQVTAISLGPRVMRADTAAVAALAVVQAVLGDWR